MNTHSRRSVLGHIALVGVTASLAKPAKGASYDPVFEAIESHRKAVDDVRAACAESDRLCDLADRIAGKHEVVIIPDLTVAGCFSDLHTYFPGDENRDLRAIYVQKLDERQAARDAVYGDIDAVISGPCAAECDAVDALVEVVPTTLPGLLALVHLAEANQADPELICEHHIEPLLANLGEAAARLSL